MTSEWPQNDLPQTGPEMALRWPSDGPQIPYTEYKGSFDVLLTIAEVLTLMSKDWIRPPTWSQELTNGC